MSPLVLPVEPPVWEPVPVAARSESVCDTDEVGIDTHPICLLPTPLPRLPGFGLSACSLSTNQTSGDFYDVVPLTIDSALLVIADVMGKGIRAGLFAAALRALIRSLLQSTRDPAELLTRVNQLMYAELSQADVFVTAQIATLDTRRRSLQVACAGHCPLLLAAPATLTVRAIPAQAMPIGIMPELTVASETILLAPSACAVMYTDGVPDTRNSEGEFFGQQRLEHWLSQAANRSQGAGQLQQDLRANLDRFQGHEPPRDDRTFLLVADESALEASEAAWENRSARWAQTP